MSHWTDTLFGVQMNTTLASHLWSPALHTISQSSTLDAALANFPEFPDKWSASGDIKMQSLCDFGPTHYWTLASHHQTKGCFVCIHYHRAVSSWRRSRKLANPSAFPDKLSASGMSNCLSANCELICPSVNLASVRLSLKRGSVRPSVNRDSGWMSVKRACSRHSSRTRINRRWSSRLFGASRRASFRSSKAAE
jgi:hypothetical protein